MASTALISKASIAAEKLVEAYYKQYDAKNHVIGFPSFIQVHQMMIKILYKNDAAIVWNGHVFTGPDPFISFVMQLPPTRHDIQSFDSQPLGRRNGTNCNYGLWIGSVLEFVSQNVLPAIPTHTRPRV